MILRRALPAEVCNLIARHGAATHLQAVSRRLAVRRRTAWTRRATWPALRAALRSAGCYVPGLVARLAANSMVRSEWLLEPQSWIDMLHSDDGTLLIIVAECDAGRWEPRQSVATPPRTLGRRV